VTRREWLEKNPPPRAGKTVQALLDGLNLQNEKRAALVQLRDSWILHRDHWQTQTTVPGVAAKAQDELRNANYQIGEADKQLATTADVPARIQQLAEELKRAARCPVHQMDLHRSMNRAEDMFTCEVGPHHLLWTRVNGAPALLQLEDLALPGIEYPMTDGKKISRAQFLASRPPINAMWCAIHPDEAIEHKPSDRIDVFRCKDTPDQIQIWTPIANGNAGRLQSWPYDKPLPALEDPIG
jgi:hypothetical protein